MIREPPWLTLLLIRRERVAQTARHWRLPEMDREGQFIDRDRANAQTSNKATRIIDLHELQITVRYQVLFSLASRSTHCIRTRGGLGKRVAIPVIHGGPR